MNDVLKSLYSRPLHINANVHQSSILGFTLFLIVINVIPNVFSCQLFIPVVVVSPIGQTE